MKTSSILSVFLITPLFAEPLLDSWFTSSSGLYSRVFETTTDEANGNSVTIWSGQDLPVYSDIQAVSYSADWVYVEYSGLSSHMMGPWLKPNGDQFQFWPANQKNIHRFPRNPEVVLGPLSQTGGGYSGLWANGVALFGALDGQAWDGSEIHGQSPHTQPTYFWHRNAPVAEAFNFDAANAHQPPTSIYHTHQNPIALRHQLGDHVDYDSATNTYTEATGTPSHSPILGWSHDGYPIYGPYGYDDPAPSSLDTAVRRMVSGYIERDGQNGSSNVNANRATVPAWYARYRETHFSETYATTVSDSRPAVNTAYPLGTFAQDHDYLGDLTNPLDAQPYVFGEDFDLDETNSRFCRTPEYPDGTIAYFVAIDDAGESVYPYVLAFEFSGNDTGGTVNTISETVTSHFTGGPDTELILTTPSVDSGTNDVTLVWSSVEGGTYLVESSPDDATYSEEVSGVASGGLSTSAMFNDTDGAGFAKVTRSAIAAFDPATTSTFTSSQTDTEAYGTPSTDFDLGNLDITLSSAGATQLVDLNEIYGRTDLTYTLDSVTPLGVIDNEFVNGSSTIFDAVAVGSVGDSATVTISAADSGGTVGTVTFTVTIAEDTAPSDSLGQLLASWYVDDSARYARIYETYEDEEAQTAVTVWNNGIYAQTVPAYGGIQEIRYDDSNVYVRTTGLSAGHVMGPWYNNTGPGGSEEVFKNWPEAIQTIYRYTTNPVIPATKTDIPGATIGLMVDGTFIFSSSDTFSYDNSEDGTGTGSQTGPGAGGFGRGDGIWNHDAYVTESNTFDKSNAHAARNQLHYHASPMKLRHLLGDSVDATTLTSGEVVYSENFNGKHSPIIGWLDDGLPLYGPYGYSSPLDPEGGVRRMISGFTLRDGTDGTYDISTNGRRALPAWAARRFSLGTMSAQDQHDLGVDDWGPDVSASAPLSYYMEDYAYKGDLNGFSVYESGGLDETVHYDLNEQNVRFCVTPEFPEGTWAYFTNIDAAGNPVFPYNVSAQYYGDPASAETLDAFPDDLTTSFSGGPDIDETNRSIAVSGDDVILTWNVAEGGTYEVQTSTDLETFSDPASGVMADYNILATTDTPGEGVDKKFYRITRTGLANHDDGSEDGGNTGGGGADTFAAQFSTDPPLPPQGAVTSITIGNGGPTATITSYDQNSGAVDLSFDGSSLSSDVAYPAILSFSPGGTPRTVESNNTYSP